MAAIAENRVTIDQVAYNLVPRENPTAQNGTAKQVHDFVTSAYGTWRITQLPWKIGDVVAETATLAGMAKESVQPLRDGVKVFKGAANGMIFGYWIWTMFEWDEQSSKVAAEGTGEQWVELGRRSVDCVTAGCHSMATLVPSAKSTLGNVALMTDLANDTIEACQAAVKWGRADELLTRCTNLSEDVQAGLQSEKTLHLISLTKSVLAVVAGIFGLLGLLLGVAIVPSIVLLTLGLATCSLAFVKHFFKENIPQFINREIAPIVV